MLQRLSCCLGEQQLGAHRHVEGFGGHQQGEGCADARFVLRIVLWQEVRP